MAAGTSHSSSAALPAGQAMEYDRYIESQLRRTRQQVKAVDLASGLMLLAAGSLGYLMLAALADQWLVSGGLGFWGRVACLAGFVICVIVFLLWRVAPLLFKRINPVYAADTIERSRPTLKNSLINFLLLRASPQGIPQRMYQAMEEQAVVGLTSTNVDAAVDRTPLIRFLIVLLVAVASCALYRVLSPKNPFTSMRRVIIPWADIEAPTRVSIDEIQPGDGEGYHDARLTVSAVVRGMRQGEQVSLIYSTADGQVVDHAVPMTLPESSYRYAAELPADAAGLQQDLFYRIAAGDAVSPRYQIRVLTPPSISVERVEYDYPAYTEIPHRTVERQGDIDALEGTRVTIHAKASHPIRTADLDFDCDGQRDLSMKVDGRQASASFALKVTDAGKAEYETYQLRFTNDQGHENPKPIRHKITVVGDLPPEMAIVEPKFDAQVEYAWPAGSKLRLKLTASDPDFKLAEVKLNLRRGEEKLLEKQMLPEALAGEYAGSYLLDSRALKLNEGDVLELWAAAADNKQPQPNVTETSHFALRVVSPDGAKNDNDNQLAQNSPDGGRRDSKNDADRKPQRADRNDPAQRKGNSTKQDEEQQGDHKPSRGERKQRRQKPTDGERKQSEPGRDHSPDEMTPPDKDQAKSGEKQQEKSSPDQSDRSPQDRANEQQPSGGKEQGEGKDQGGRGGNTNQEKRDGESGDDRQDESDESPDGKGADGKLADNKSSRDDKRSQDEKSSSASSRDDDSRVEPDDLARAMEKISKLTEDKPEEQSGDDQKPSDASQPAGRKPQDQLSKSDQPKGDKKNSAASEEQNGEESPQPGKEKQDGAKGPQADEKKKPGESGDPGQNPSDENASQRPQSGEKHGNNSPAADKLRGNQAAAERQTQTGDDRGGEEPQPSEETNPRASDAKQGERREAGENNERQKNRGDLQLEDRKGEDAEKQPHSGEKPHGQEQAGDEKQNDEHGDGAQQQEDKDGQPQGGGQEGMQPGGKKQTSAKPGQQASGEKGGKTDSENGLSNEGTPRKPTDGQHKGEQAAGGDQEYKHADGEKKPQDGQGGKTKGIGEPDDKEKPDRENKHAQEQKGGSENSLDRGDAGAGQQGDGNKNGSPEAQRENAEKEKHKVSPDSDRPDSEDKPESPSISKKQSDSEGGEAGNLSGGGKKGGGQRSNSAGVGSAGQNTAADEGGGEIEQKGDGATGTKGGDRVKGDATQGGKPSQEKGTGSTTKPGGDKSGGDSKEPPPEGVNPNGLKPDANASHRTDQAPPPDSKLPKANNVDPNATHAPPKGELPPDAGEGQPKSAHANPSDSGGNQEGGGNDNPTGGGLPGPNSTPRRQSSAPEPGGEDPKLEYSRKATDLTLDRLKDQLAKNKPDQELLDKLKWSRSDMEQFVRRWEELKRAAKAQGPKGEAAREELDETYRSLSLRPHGATLKQGEQRDDRSRDLRQTRRTKPPAEYEQQYREFSKSTSKK